MAISSAITILSKSSKVDNYLFVSKLLLFIFAPLFFISLFGVSVVNCVQFFCYVFVFHGINGILVLSLLKQDLPDSLKISGILLSGMSFNIITFFILGFFHLQQYTYLNLFFISVLVFIFKTRVIKLEPMTRQDLFISGAEYLLLVFAIFIGSLQSILLTELDSHFLFQGLLASSVANFPYPYKFLCFPEIPFYYNYGLHFEMANCSLVTSIPLEVLSGRLYPFYILFLLSYTVYAFCKQFFEGKWITGGLVILNNFCIVGMTTWSTTFFLNWLPTSVCKVSSYALGITMFFFLVPRILNFLNLPKFRYIDLLFLFLMFLAGSITRSAFPIVLGGGLTFFIVFKFLQTKQMSSILRPIILNVILGISFFIALVSVYGFFSEYSATDAMKFTLLNRKFDYSYIFENLKLTFPFVFQNYPLLGAASTSFIHFLLAPGFLLIGFYYQIFVWLKEGIRDLDLFLICCAFTGIFVWNFSETSGHSYYTFHHYFCIICGIFGANGTYLIFKNFVKERNRTIEVLTALSIMMIFTKTLELYKSFKSGVEWEKVGFLKQPNYGKWSNAFLNKLRELSDQDKNIIIFSLLKDKTHQDVNLLNIHLKNVPLYDSRNLAYMRDSFYSSSNLKDRLLEINHLLIKENGVDDSLISALKRLFIKNEIILLCAGSQNITSSDLSLLDEIDGIKIMKISNH